MTTSKWAHHSCKLRHQAYLVTVSQPDRWTSRSTQAVEDGPLPVYPSNNAFLPLTPSRQLSQTQACFCPLSAASLPCQLAMLLSKVPRWVKRHRHLGGASSMFQQVLAVFRGPRDGVQYCHSGRSQCQLSVMAWPAAAASCSCCMISRRALCVLRSSFSSLVATSRLRSQLALRGAAKDRGSCRACWLSWAWPLQETWEGCVCTHEDECNLHLRADAGGETAMLGDLCLTCCPD